MSGSRRFVALTGGVGGAKLALGLSAQLTADELLLVANTGDDFEHLGLPISPDLDTVMYTLAGLADPERGWGLAGESWQCMESIARLGGPDWFRLGDRDLATHLRRGMLLRDGLSLAEATVALCRSLGLRHALRPMSSDPVRTLLDTSLGELAFQDYFVRERCAPRVHGIRYEGAPAARPDPEFLAWLDAGAVVLLCPSNPWLSVEPLLVLPGVRERVAAACSVAVSPIVGGRALKGPAAEIMAQLGLEPSALGVARHYRGLLRGLVIDRVDAGQAEEIRALGMAVRVTDTVMTDTASKARLADEVLDFAGALGE